MIHSAQPWAQHSPAARMDCAAALNPADVPLVVAPRQKDWSRWRLPDSTRCRAATQPNAATGMLRVRQRRPKVAQTDRSRRKVVIEAPARMS